MSRMCRVMVGTVGGEDDSFHASVPVQFAIAAELTGHVDRWSDGVIRSAEVMFATGSTSSPSGRVVWVPAKSILETGPCGGLFPLDAYFPLDREQADPPAPPSQHDARTLAPETLDALERMLGYPTEPTPGCTYVISPTDCTAIRAVLATLRGQRPAPSAPAEDPERARQLARLDDAERALRAAHRGKLPSDAAILRAIDAVRQAAAVVRSGRAEEPT